MEPRIQYAKTKDGVSIAFWTLGEGEPLVHTPLLVSNIQLEWQIPQIRAWYERLARSRKLIRYDFRGSGLSQRNVASLSFEAQVLDLEAVVDRLGLEKFVLCGFLHSGPPAIAYAARHPGQVLRLILWGTYARGTDWSQAPQTQAVRALMDKDWTFYSEALARSFLGWSEGEPARRYAALVRESIAPELLQRAIPALNEYDVRALLPQVRSPTLVLHRRSYALLNVGAGMTLASGLPDARLVVLEGESGAPYLGDMEAVASAIDEFLSEGSAAEPSAATVPSGMVTILFTDIGSSTAITQRMGDARAQELVRAHNTIVREALKAHGGSEIKHTGDGIMASFTTASRALECAVTIQRAVAAHVDQHADSPLGVHIGLNAGEPVAEEEDLFGTAVQLARRICDHAAAGQVLVSNVVRELAAGKSFMFSDIGEVLPKGFEDPVKLWEVRWREEG